METRIDHNYDTDITKIYIKNRVNIQKSVFIFDWSINHWKNHYSELRYILPHSFYHLKDWEHIMRVASGIDPLTYALLYMNDKSIGNHIPFVAKLLVKYGINSIKFKID